MGAFEKRIGCDDHCASPSPARTHGTLNDVRGFTLQRKIGKKTENSLGRVEVSTQTAHREREQFRRYKLAVKGERVQVHIDGLWSEKEISQCQILCEDELR